MFDCVDRVEMDQVDAAHSIHFDPSPEKMTGVEYIIHQRRDKSFTFRVWENISNSTRWSTPSGGV